MQRKLFFILFITLFFSFSCVSYEREEEILSKVDADVWEPFVESFNSMEVEKYLSVHNANMLRISNDLANGVVQYGNEYFETLRKQFSRMKQSYKEHEIRFFFTDRLASQDVVRDEGYYTYKALTKDNKEVKITGKFLVVSKRFNDKFQMVFDYDFTDTYFPERFFN